MTLHTAVRRLRLRQLSCVPGTHLCGVSGRLPTLSSSRNIGNRARGLPCDGPRLELYNPFVPLPAEASTWLQALKYSVLFVEGHRAFGAKEMLHTNYERLAAAAAAAAAIALI